MLFSGYKMSNWVAATSVRKLLTRIHFDTATVSIFSSTVMQLSFYALTTDHFTPRRKLSVQTLNI